MSKSPVDLEKIERLLKTLRGMLSTTAGKAAANTIGGTPNQSPKINVAPPKPIKTPTGIKQPKMGAKTSSVPKLKGITPASTKDPIK
jgi:hypothetical protein